MKNIGFKLTSILLIATLIILISCEKRDFKIVVKVETENAAGITAKQAKIAGIIIDAGNGLSDYGHCWSTKTNPGTNDFKTSLGNTQTSGNFSSDLTSLLPGIKYYVRAYAVNGKETIFSKEVSFTTMDGKAILTTADVTDISLFTAKGGGNITSANGDEVLGKGICWDTLSTVSLKKKSGFTQIGTGLGPFTSDLSGLKRGKTYYVKAWARTSVDTTYGETKTFTTFSGIPSLTTNNISSIRATTAISGGNITNDGGSPITARGVCWGKLQNPTIADSKTSEGNGIGSFSSNLVGLNINTTYYIRAYVTNNIGTFYGTQVSFSTKSGIAILTSKSVTELTALSAVSGGTITDDGGSEITARGVCWSTNQNPSLTENSTSNGTGIGDFSSSITSLNHNTIYYLRAYATNSIGTTYGQELTFTTKNGVAILNSTSGLRITAFSTSSGGNITSDGGAEISARGVCWSTSQNPIATDSHTSDGTGIGSFVSSISDLTPNTIYYVRSYATNSINTYYGNEISVKTALPPSIGSTYAGGIVFYLDGTGKHGFTCAPSDQSTSAVWGCLGTVMSTGFGVGSGMQNTLNIVNRCSTPGIAARICYDLILNEYDDWFLPSYDELGLIRSSKIGGFDTKVYWSSSEDPNNSYLAYNYCFDSFCYLNPSKINGKYVRAIRAF